MQIIRTAWTIPDHSSDFGSYFAIENINNILQALATFDANGNILALSSNGYIAGRVLTASASLSDSDSGTLINADHASVPIVLTIQNDATGLWNNTAILSVYQAGAAAVSFAAGSGVTLHVGAGIPAAAQYGIYGVLRVSANEWVTF
jgi:hypothetical protein